MGDSFDLNEYIRYIRGRWLRCFLANAVAVLLTVAISFLMPKQYSSTARVLIEPRWADGRATVSMSPAYLDSLRTYESFASSDTLFQQAVEKFGLRQGDPGEPLESLKRRVLRVTKPRSLRLLLITVTLPDPRKAAAVAAFLAAESVAQSNAGQDAAAIKQAGLIGERLRVIDSGTVPQQPASPDITLNAAVSLVLSLTASILYLTAGFSLRQARTNTNIRQHDELRQDRHA